MTHQWSYGEVITAELLNDLEARADAKATRTQAGGVIVGEGLVVEDGVLGIDPSMSGHIHAHATVSLEDGAATVLTVEVQDWDGTLPPRGTNFTLTVEKTCPKNPHGFMLAVNGQASASVVRTHDSGDPSKIYTGALNANEAYMLFWDGYEMQIVNALPSLAGAVPIASSNEGAPGLVSVPNTGNAIMVADTGAITVPVLTTEDIGSGTAGAVKLAAGGGLSVNASGVLSVDKGWVNAAIAAYIQQSS